VLDADTEAMLRRVRLALDERARAEADRNSAWDEMHEVSAALFRRPLKECAHPAPSRDDKPGTIYRCYWSIDGQDLAVSSIRSPHPLALADKTMPEAVAETCYWEQMLANADLSDRCYAAWEKLNKTGARAEAAYEAVMRATRGYDMIELAVALYEELARARDAGAVADSESRDCAASAAPGST